MQWIPYTLPWDDAPLDLSYLYEDEKPAGKHGFLKVDGTRFVFEDGYEPRFWGTLFNSAANYPPHEYSEKTARRLAKFGVNMVRTHQMDAEWCTPNIFYFTRGRERDNSLSFDPESLDRFDYMIHCLKNEGIYIYLDQLSHRTFKPGDGVENAHELTRYGAKPYANFDPRLIELQKQYSRDLWTHVNPYTGLAYKDDPAVALMEIANENDLLSRHVVTVEPYRFRLEKRYRQWAAERDIPVGDEKVDFANRTPVMLRFLHDVQVEFYEDMVSHLRSIGVKVPITGSNWYHGGLALTSALQGLDYRDAHAYWDMWSDTKGNNRPLISEKDNIMLKGLCSARLLDRPFFVSEWDVVWPNEWRGTAPLVMASAGCLQGWNGLTIHTYRYRSTSPVDCMGAVVMDGVGYRVNFDTFNDPARFGLFYHAALVFRRGDVAAAEKTVSVAADEDTIFGSPDSALGVMGTLPEEHRTGVVLPGQSPPVDITMEAAGEKHAGSGEIVSDTGQIRRDAGKGIGSIDTANTKAAYGFLGKGGTIHLDGLTLTVKTHFAVVAISSLTDEPIASSANLLLTTVGRADNTGARYNEDHTERLDLGHVPVVVEAIEAKIELATAQEHLEVWSIDPEGHLTGRVPATLENGVLTFETGEAFPSMYYLIQR
jgi:hypothetical protein